MEVSQYEYNLVFGRIAYVVAGDMVSSAFPQFEGCLCTRANCGKGQQCEHVLYARALNLPRMSLLNFENLPSSRKRGRPKKGLGEWKKNAQEMGEDSGAQESKPTQRGRKNAEEAKGEGGQEEAAKGAEGNQKPTAGDRPDRYCKRRRHDSSDADSGSVYSDGDAEVESDT